ncbi:2Fe-2S iron-sulfur cluster binding domain-containing protein [Pseudaminobacter sp. 19-2017]|uniref:2Fe-2S iron-sulfur cluster binding domain-containing protein n=1 Tax=Pseudaminobacter soli (ex Zhang et al. 2022) TaxID=2831468 RepID=A0A942E0R7_9HYPH|nr:2Fe-2S iron-sulfur cluster-binding protein [Pseudaminobacter soli]MBS3651629.1 2Fe-2S iron-sulfur cluster binding domain-containing protein [Pseudaminobacter soli]
MNGLRLTVNGLPVAEHVEPRTSLADLLRENLNLTGTHLGCEQGVCGACTVFVDGVPVRSCISTAVSCSGADVRTIESFDADPLMGELREAFNKHHALQCGFCTPGMLVMARDIVERLGDADEERIRLELAGNLCRCTGYAGIVKAIRSVVLARQAAGTAPSLGAPQGLGPAGSGHGQVTEAKPRQAMTPPIPASSPKSAKLGKLAATAPSVKQSFVIEFPPETVWSRFGDVPAMVPCIPGASLVGRTDDGNFQVSMRVKMGPIGAQFAGTANQQRNDDMLTGVIHGSGRDERSGSLARGELSYALHEMNGGAATRVDLEVTYSLSGALGQFARGGIVTHFIAAITAQFADNLKRSLSPEEAPNATQQPRELRLAGSMATALKSWLGATIRKLFSR